MTLFWVNHIHSTDYRNLFTKPTHSVLPILTTIADLDFRRTGQIFERLFKVSPLYAICRLYMFSLQMWGQVFSSSGSSTLAVPLPPGEALRVLWPCKR